MDFGNFKRFHFIGIGGIGMSGLAEILLGCGLSVSGSDLQESPLTERLRRLGARIHLGHDASYLQDAQAIVYSSAVKRDNPEFEEAARKALPRVHRGELLAEVIRRGIGVTVCGTHGKTTTTSMIALMLVRSGHDPTVLIGARLKALGGNARRGKSELIVAEADESDRSFLLLAPVYAVATNIDTDHMDEYRDLDDLQESFHRYLNSVPFYGAAVACWDDPHLRPVLKKVHRRVISYGLSADADYSARHVELRPLSSRYECFQKESSLGWVEVGVPGIHNVLNSLAAVAVGMQLGVAFEQIARSLAEFKGAERRLERKGERDGVLVLDDYGHHPTEVRVTLTACRSLQRRIVAVFQPHRFTRTMHLMEELSRCFSEADLLFLMDIYPAGEEPISGVNSGALAQRIAERRTVDYVADRQELVRRLKAETRPGDVLLTLGAGDVWKIGEAFLEQK